MVKILRLRKAQQDLKQALGRRRRAKILPSYDEVHARCRIIDDAGKVIGGWRVLSREYGIAEVGPPTLMQGATMFGPAGKAGPFQRLRDVDPPAMWRRSAPL